MSAPLELVLANALGAGLLAIGAWVVSRHARRQALVHALWVLALVKLVAPPIVPLPLLPEWTLPALSLPDAPAIVVIETTSVAMQGTPADLDPDPAPGTPTALETLLAAEGATLPVPDATTTSSLLDTEAVAAPSAFPVGLDAAEARMAWTARDLARFVWLGLLGGALMVAALTILRIRRFRRLLRLAAPAPPALSARASELAVRVGLRRAPPVLLLPARVPPMLWPGRRGPLLLMPAGLLPELTAEERDTLLLHELAHVRRRDHWVRMLELTVTIAFWWYPVTWWVRRALRRAEERCCDEWVLRVMPTSAHAYAEGLLKSLDFVAGEPDPLPVGASGAGPVRDLEARLKEILMMTPTPHLAPSARLALVVAAVLGLAVFPTQAQSPAPAPEAEPTLSSPPEAPPAPPAVPTPTEAPPAPPSVPEPPPLADLAAPAAPTAPTRPADASLPALASPAMPALPAAPTADVWPTLTAPAVPAPPADETLPALATPATPMPRPAPGPVVAPTPRAVASVAPAPPMPRPAPRPVAVPAPRDESPEDTEARRELEEIHEKNQAEREALHRRELEIASARMTREAAAQQKALQAEADRLRAVGEEERATLLDKQARTAAERSEIQRRDIELERRRMAQSAAQERALSSTTEKLHVLEREGQEAEAARVRAKLKQLEEEYARSHLEYEAEQLALQRETLEVEHRAQLAELRLAEEWARGDLEALEAEREQAREHMQQSQRMRQRELEAQAAAHAAHAKEREASQLEAAGRRDEANAARAASEKMRQELDVERRSLQEERLVEASEDLELQIEAQLEALRQLESEGATSPEAQEKIRRLEAALAALRQ